MLQEGEQFPSCLWDNLEIPSILREHGNMQFIYNVCIATPHYVPIYDTFFLLDALYSGLGQIRLREVNIRFSRYRVTEER